MKTNILIRNFLFLFSFFMINFSGFAQTGRIIGTVTDVSTGESLPGANIMLEGTTFGAATDRFGHYELERVPSGSHTLTAKYIGYENFSTSVTVTSGRTLELNIQLTLTAVEIEDVVVQGLRQGQVKALNQQLNANNIKNILSREEMEKFPDMNTAETLQRVPGVQISRSLGEGRFVYLRGTEPRLTNVTVNGQKISSPREEDRFLGLDVINSSQLASIEVSKALTPDMDGDAIAGTVDLVTRSAFDFEKTTLKINIGGGYSDLGQEPLYRGSAMYSMLLGAQKNFGITLNASWYRNNITSHSNEFDWTNEEDVNGVELPFVLGDYRTYLYRTTRDHIGFSGAFEYKPDNNNSYFINGMYNRRSDDQVRNMVRLRVNRGDYLNRTTVTDARMAFELAPRNEIQNLYNVVAGGRNNFGSLDLDYTFSYSYGNEETSDEGQLKSEWQLDQRLNIVMNLDDVDFPTYQITNSTREYTLDPAHWEVDAHDFRERSATNNNFLGTANIKVPYALGNFQSELKAGAKLTMNQKDRNSKRFGYDWQGDDLFMTVASTGETITDFLDNTSVFGPIMDGEKMVEYLKSHIDPDNGFREEENVLDTDALGGRYDATEDIYAGYIMTSININDLLVVAGVRNEYTKTTYKGNDILVDEDGALVSTKEVENDNSYNNIFPALHLRYSISPLTNIRLAYTQGIARPNYFDLAPFTWVNPDDEEIFKGNPDLEPTESKNIDFMFGHYFQGIGAINLGLFYKMLDKVIYENTVQLSGGAYDGYNEITTINGGSADLYGFEVSWMQQFTFLPGFLSGFGVYANYTFTESKADLQYRDWDVLPGQAGDVGNFGLSYERDGLTARLSLNYTDEVLYQVGETEDYDRYYDSRIQLDFSGSYQFWKGFEFYVEMINITDAPQREYFHLSSRPRLNEYYGWSLRSGIKLDM